METRGPADPAEEDLKEAGDIAEDHNGALKWAGLHRGVKVTRAHNIGDVAEVLGKEGTVIGVSDSLLDLVPGASREGEQAVDHGDQRVQIGEREPKLRDLRRICAPREHQEEM